MIRTMLAGVTMVMLMVLAGPAMAASFDCMAAATPFEHAICDNPELSSADEVLAKTFATSLGGLTKAATTAMRTDQREWLDFAGRACTDNAQPLAEGDYNSDQVYCLTNIFRTRSRDLEQSRMFNGHRFYLESSFEAMPDPQSAADPNSSWKVATHQTTVALLDSDDALAEKFNAFARQEVEKADGQETEIDGTSDSDTTLSVHQVTDNRISLQVTSYWYGHGAAHGNRALTYLHYLPGEDRIVEASDIFAAEGWQKKLLELSVAELKANLGEWLMLDDEQYIADVVINPARWDFESDYGLTIQFNPYEVAPYAYGTPTIMISWEKLEDLLADSADTIRYSY